MFWTRTPEPAATPSDAHGASGVLHSAASRSMGFLSSLDLRGGSDSRLPLTNNQSAGENAREDVANGNSNNEDRESDSDLDAASAALPPSYILSEQRRHELLAAARATRTSWVDGKPTQPQDHSTHPQWKQNGSGAAVGEGTVPAHCQHAIEQISSEMQTFMASLDQLKRKIIRNDVLATGLDGELNDDGNNETERHKRVTIVEELRMQQSELESWRRVHLLHGKLSPMQRKRLTASDKECLFLLAFQELLVLLKHPLAAEIVYQIQMFVQKFEHWNLEVMLRHRAMQDRPGGHVQAFIDKLVYQLQRAGASLFAAAAVEILSLDDDEDQLLHEVLEAFLLEKLYTKALTPSVQAETEDDALRARLSSLNFVEFRHLDLPVPTSEDTQLRWDALVEQLALIAVFPSPRRKMDCVMRVCQELTTLLSSLHAHGKFPSADEFLPGLIYLLLKANPAYLKRTVHLILEYRRPSRLVSEPGYFFTHLVSSVAFLEQVNGELLTITPEEFEAGLRRSKKQVADEGNDLSTARTQVILAARDVSPCKQLDESGPEPEPARQPQLPTVLEVRARRLAVLNAQAVHTA